MIRKYVIVNPILSTTPYCSAGRDDDDDKNLRHRVAYVIIRREPRSSAQNVARCCCLCYGPLDENLLNARISFPIPRLVPLNV